MTTPVLVTLTALVLVEVVLYVAIDPFGRRARARWERTWQERTANTRRTGA